MMPCPICGGSKTGVLRSKNGYPVARCRACAHLFSARMPSRGELAEYYARYCYEQHGLDRVPDFVLARLAEIVATFGPYRRTNRLLDVGFGAGALLKVAQADGWDVHGLELSSLSVAQARRNGFANTVEGDFLKAPYDDASFDVVVAVELLEHLPDPLPFIGRASQLLAPGGLFYLTTPNGAGLSESMLGLDWSVVSPPEHLNLFSPQSLRRALMSRGFRDVRIASEGINPHEILDHFRRRVRPAEAASSDQSFNRHASSSAINEALSGTRAGSAFKRAANCVLRAMAWGDGLKAWAER